MNIYQVEYTFLTNIGIDSGSYIVKAQNGALASQICHKEIGGRGWVKWVKINQAFIIV